MAIGECRHTTASHGWRNLADTEPLSTPILPAATNAAKPWILPVFALLCTFVAYCRTLKFQFVYDDQTIILANPAIQSWHYLPQYFTRHFWAGVYPEGPGNYYRPVCLLWLRINYMAFGTHAWAWHLSTIFLHLAATFMVYLLARRLLQDAWPAALAVAAANALGGGLRPQLYFMVRGEN
jgi:4-amino-4-deoxy-L-arabinose transferase-like glycosyltransferase